MDKNKIELLLKRFRLGLCSPEEIKALEDWFQDQYNNSNFLWDDIAKRNFKNHLDAKILRELAEEKPSKVISFYQKKYFRLFVAASFFGIAILFSVWHFSYYNNRSEQSLAQRYKNDVAPGKVGATWKIDQNIIYLSESKKTDSKKFSIARQTQETLIFDSVFIKNQLFHNFIKTDNGQQYKIVLSDGSKIWMNAASSISFDQPFNNNNRVIHVTGEAYFEVTHDPKKPFIVVSNTDSITVLGTHFNVNSYDDEPFFTTTLLEGAIAYIGNVNKTSKKHLLKPEDQLKKNNNSIIINHIDDADNKAAWKDGYFSFSNESIESVMRQLARWYNLKVVYNNNIYKEKFYGDLRKDAPLSAILSVLEKSGVKFLIDGNKVTVL